MVMMLKEVPAFPARKHAFAWECCSIFDAQLPPAVPAILAEVKQRRAATRIMSFIIPCLDARHLSFAI
jgi:hypothetical protein